MDSTNHQGHVSTDGLVKPVVVWKIMIGGKGAVGKTTIIKRYLSGEFCGNTMMTIGVQFHIQELKRRGCTIKLSLWDLGGQERFQFLLPNYCEGASGGIVLFAMNDLETLDDALTWVSMFRSRFTSNVPIILVGTKLDLVDPSQWDEIGVKALEFATKNGCIAYIPTSSKTGHNVAEAIHYLVDHLIDSCLINGRSP